VSSRNKILSDMLSKKKYVFELILVGFFIAFGVNLISSTIIQALNISSINLLFVSIIIIIISFYLLFHIIIDLKSIRKIVHGFLLYNKKLMK
jgi:hypothetical protein